MVNDAKELSDRFVREICESIEDHELSILIDFKPSIECINFNVIVTSTAPKFIGTYFIRQGVTEVEFAVYTHENYEILDYNKIAWEPFDEVQFKIREHFVNTLQSAKVLTLN